MLATWGPLLCELKTFFFFGNAANDRRILWNSKNDFGGSILISNNYMLLKKSSKQKVCLWHDPFYNILHVFYARQEGASDKINRQYFCLIAALGLLGWAHSHATPVQ